MHFPEVDKLNENIAAVEVMLFPNRTMKNCVQYINWGDY